MPTPLQPRVERTAYGYVRQRVHRSRRRRRCECGLWIEASDLYRRLTALPGHEFAPPWDTLIECGECADRRDRPLPVGDVAGQRGRRT